MLGLRIILDKSVVRGLNNLEVDSLDRYFIQIIPPILTNEILADLTKEAKEPNIVNIVAGQSYRITGNRVLTEDYRTILAHSLMGYEVPMEGKILPAGETTVRSSSGSIGTKVQTGVEDRTILRWERKVFTEQEKKWGKRWRPKMERGINPKMYTDKIAEAGLKFTPPDTEEELASTVDSLLQERRLQARLFPLISKEHDIPFKSQAEVIKRWFKVGKPMFQDFAPYAFFCLRANFLWALSLTNPKLFKPDRNDRKDLEYCYHLPHCEMFSSRDDKHKRLVPFLLRQDQSFVDSEELKIDLRKLSEEWEALNTEEKIQANRRRGSAPPEDEDSVVFRLWKKHRKEIKPSVTLEINNAEPVVTSEEKREPSELSFEDFLRSKIKEIEESEQLSGKELAEFREKHGSGTFLHRKFTMTKGRLMKLFPGLKESDLEKSNED